ncbi:hypothetical protein ACVWYG_003922 [Pedobacter sp. UYEF25]
MVKVINVTKKDFLHILEKVEEKETVLDNLLDYPTIAV